MAAQLKYFIPREREKREMGKARKVGIGMDYSPTSKSALRWTIENLIDPGDLVVVVHVLSSKSDPTSKKLFEDTGSRT